ncbi:peroxiredoxin family protein [Acidobacteriota bacterium]
MKPMKQIMSYLLVTLLIFSVISSCKKSPDIGVLIGNEAPNFSEPNSQGNLFTLSSLRGKVILLNFTTMWCGPCRQEAADLMPLYAQYNAQGLEIVVCLLEDEDQNPTDLNDLNVWIDEYGFTFPVIHDPDSSTENTYQIVNVPTNIIIDRDFVIRYRQEGYRPTEIADWITDLL